MYVSTNVKIDPLPMEMFKSGGNSKPFILQYNNLLSGTI